MSNRSLREAIFRLGRISVDQSITNETLLRRLAEVVAETLGVQLVALGVFENGVDKPAAACFVHSPWTLKDARAFEDQTFWGLEDLELASRLASLRRGRLYQRSELVTEREGRVTTLRSDFAPRAGLDDQALDLFRRRDGVELLIGINSPAGAGPLSRATLAEAAALAPYVAQCWAAVWRREPAWMAGLKPQAREILERLLQGLDDDQIAKATSLSYHSVRAHLKRMFRAAGVRSRLHLMQSCRRDPCEPELAVDPDTPAEPARTATSAVA